MRYLRWYIDHYDELEARVHEVPVWLQCAVMFVAGVFFMVALFS